MTGVPVSDSTSTIIGSDSARINTPTSVAYLASGTIAPAGNGGAVRATQALTSGPTIEVGYSAADSTGAYSMNLPAGAPAKLPYVAGATTFAFDALGATDTLNAGKYKLEASATVGTSVVTKPAVDITLTGPVTTNFAF